ncbi:MAG: hypothetical protein ACE5KR_00330, partial [Candidatus Bipolaricaulia bacterium]
TEGRGLAPALRQRAARHPHVHRQEGRRRYSRLEAQSAEKGEAQEVLKLLRPAAPLKVSFKAEYLIEALKKMNSTEVTFWLNDPESAGLLEPSGEEDSGFLYVCMPIRMD